MEASEDLTWDLMAGIEADLKELKNDCNDILSRDVKKAASGRGCISIRSKIKATTLSLSIVGNNKLLGTTGIWLATNGGLDG